MEEFDEFNLNDYLRRNMDDVANNYNKHLEKIILHAIELLNNEKYWVKYGLTGALDKATRDICKKAGIPFNNYFTYFMIVEITDDVYKLVQGDDNIENLYTFNDTNEYVDIINKLQQTLANSENFPKNFNDIEGLKQNITDV